jgi:thiol peroxidase
MALETTHLKGKLVNLLDSLPEINENAFDFTFVKPDMTEGSLYDYEGKVRVLIGVPSLDTGLCAIETRQFNQRLDKKEGVVGFVISKDTPYAMRRFCELEGITNVIGASDFRYTDFTREYCTEMIDGPMKGLGARAVFVVDQKNVIKYVELTPDITVEPNYDRVMEEVDKLL